MKNKIENIYTKIKPYLPFILLFMMYLVMHYKLQYIADDLVNHDRKFENGQLDYLVSNYMHWSSRVFIYFVNNVIYMMPIIVWKVLDTAIVTIGAVCLSKLFNDKKNLFMDYAICLLVAIFPYTFMGGAGFVATTLTYYWPIVFLLIALLPVKKILNKEKINKYMIPVYTLLLLYATDNEQTCCVLLGLSICFLLYFKFIKKEKINWYIIYLLIISILKLIFIKLSPGNATRAIIETREHFPAYKDLSLIDKLYLGFVYIADLLRNNSMLIVIFSAFICILTYMNNLKPFHKAYALCNLLFVLSVTTFSTVLISKFPLFEHHIQYIGMRISSNSYDVDILTALFILISYFNMMYLIIVNFKKDFLPLILFFAGLASQYIMIFSPTVYISGYRTASLMFYSFVVIDIILYKSIENKLSENKKIIVISSLVLCALMLFTQFVCTY